MKCAEIEVLICDYLDGALAPAEREVVDRHLQSCAGCAELARDAAAAMRFMERAAAVEPPPELMTRLIFNAPWRQAAGGRSAAGARAWWGRLLQPVLQPRFVMGMALTILSFSMLGRFLAPGAGIQQADLDPARIWIALDNRAHRLWDRAVKSYESIRFVYQVQSRLREWEEQRQSETAAEAEPAPDPRRLPVGGSNSGKN
jgi:anti-sigma factor RsiW